MTYTNIFLDIFTDFRCTMYGSQGILLSDFGLCAFRFVVVSLS